MSSQKVSIIISNRNDIAMLVVTIRSCIEELVPLEGGEIVVCDNSDEGVEKRGRVLKYSEQPCQCV